MKSSFFLLFLSASCTQSLPQITPFTSDYCSYWKDGMPGRDWKECCFVHDLAYWLGGSEEQRLSADQELAQCVKSRDVLQSRLMYYGVRAGGSPYYRSDFRWGFGWPYRRGYGPLDQGELSAAMKVLKEKNYLDWEEILVKKFIESRDPGAQN